MFFMLFAIVKKKKSVILLIYLYTYLCPYI